MLMEVCMKFKLKKELIGVVGFIGILVVLFLFKGQMTVKGDVNIPIELTPLMIKVYISGEIVQPGVYEVDSDERLEAVLKLAGGFTANADQTGINLARKLKDGEMVIVYSDKGGEVKYIGVDVFNYGDEEMIITIEGIGEVLCERIMFYRENTGLFTTFDDLLNVEGIGEQKLLTIKQSIEN